MRPIPLKILALGALVLLLSGRAYSQSGHLAAWSVDASDVPSRPSTVTPILAAGAYDPPQIPAPVVLVPAVLAAFSTGLPAEKQSPAKDSKKTAPQKDH